MLSKKEFDVLIAVMGQEGASQRAISEETGYSIGTVNKLVKGLVEQGLYNGKTITEKGLETLEPYRVKRAIFLAAGFGSRLVPITLNTPKPLVRVHGKRIIETLLDAVVKAEIPEIILVRGYLGEQFEQLLHIYPQIKFVDNELYNESNNISSAYCVRDLLKNAYVLESDLLLKNPKIIRKYEYSSNFLGIPVDVTDDWFLRVDNSGVIYEQGVGGKDCHQMVGVSYWDEKDGAQLEKDLAEVFFSPGGKERYWEQTALHYKKENYKIQIRECTMDDIVEIDTFNELKQIDKIYDI
ncbi:MAG: winged helix-turn-helix transcriptional regulator [Clostridiales bacterium]|nr:winged helix-turn-helix transcriptional regulator [Clostridiales bacterium]